MLSQFKLENDNAKSIYGGEFKSTYEKSIKSYFKGRVCGKTCNYQYTLKYRTFHVYSIEEENKLLRSHDCIEFKKLSRFIM